MRKTLIAVLLASAFAPVSAYAQDGGNDRGTRVRAERAERAGQRGNDGDARSQREERAAPRQDRASRPERAERPARVERADRNAGQADGGPRLNQSGDLDRAMRSDRMQNGNGPARSERPARTEQAVRDPQTVEQVQQPAIAQPVQQPRDRPDSLVDGFRQVARGEHAGRDGDHHDHDWKKDWRKDKRYDWWHYRSRYSSLYRLGRYSDPYGWGYRRWSIGFGLWPGYYGSNYWLNDPWMYRLPPAYGPYRWVRYYDDALLVNIYTGHVVDVVYNFFW